MSKRKITILIIDDAEEDQQLIKSLLKKNLHYDYIIHSAYTGKEGFHLYSHYIKEIDCILLDQQLPDMNGLDALAIFKEQGIALPVIILTEFDSYEDDFHALEKGAADYINKDMMTPFELERSIRYAIDKQKIINQLKESNNEKEHFLRIMSHDMKTPLAGIMGYVSMLLSNESPTLNEFQKKTLEKIIKSAEYLNRIINDIMTTALIDKGKMRLHCEEFNLIEALSFCVSLVKQKAVSKHILLEFNSHSHEILIVGDKHKLTEAIENLLENAVKFTSQGSVSLKVSQNQHGVELSVRDTGIGMTQEEVSRIFDPFSQGSQTIQSKYGGLGLGLSIAKKFIQLHGGSIEVKSELHVGTEFVVHLPNRAPLCLIEENAPLTLNE